MADYIRWALTAVMLYFLWSGNKIALYVIVTLVTIGIEADLWLHSITMETIKALVGLRKNTLLFNDINNILNKKEEGTK